MTNKTRSANGRGHTYKNGNSYRTVIKHQGMVITASAKSIQESRKKARTKFEDHLKHLKVPKLNGENILLGNFLFEWLENEHIHNIAQSTYRRYHSLARCHIQPLIGKYPLTELNPNLISGLLNSMRNQGQSTRSMQQTRALLSIVLEQAESLELIASNPVKKVKNPQLKSRSISPLSLEEVRRLLGTYRGTSMGARLHVALVCGLRQGEALGLTWDDVDLLDGSINVRRQAQRINGETRLVELKTERSERMVALASETVAALAKQRDLLLATSLSRQELLFKNLVFPGESGDFKTSQTD